MWETIVKHLAIAVPEFHYARIVDGRVAQIIPIKGPPVDQRGFAPDFLASLVEVTGDIPSVGDMATQIGTRWAFAAATASAEDLGTAKSHQQAALRASCAAAIIRGFDSDALGTLHAYPFKATDQTNLMRVVTLSLVPGLSDDWTVPIWCATGAGEWVHQPHTANQVQEVGSAADAHVLACQTRLAVLVQTVGDATSIEAVHTIDWTPLA